MQPDFSSVGFFHFGKDHNKPIFALEAAIADFKSTGRILENALIVLPEAFNIGMTYYAPEPATFDLSILPDLSRVSTSSQCAFVAGLIIADTPGVYPPYNSAYLIDGSYQKRLARKRTQDDAEVSRVNGRGWSAKYTACFAPEPTPIQHRGLAIAAQICKDAQSPEHSVEPYDGYISRCERLAIALRSFGCQHSVLCVPAHMLYGFHEGRLGQNAIVREELKGTIHILANSCTGNVKSFVTEPQGEIILNAGGNVNQIITVSLTNAPVDLQEMAN
jgi:predicted amidohydrolase